jgi:hypothetical protein
MAKRIAVFIVGVVVCTMCLELGERFLLPGAHGFVATVEAIVGRPLTPVSVAGVARRTSRRCAVGVYDC